MTSGDGGLGEDQIAAAASSMAVGISDVVGVTD